MINEHILIGLIVMGIMGIISGLIILFKNKPNVSLIQNVVFGFVVGSIGSWVYQLVMTEIYPLYPIFSITTLILLGLGSIGASIEIIMREVKGK